jgi:hypothetical protein
MNVRILLVVFSMGFAGVAPGSNLTSNLTLNRKGPAHDELLGLLEARSLSELDQQQHLDAMRRDRQASCASELRLHLVPRACFREIQDEKSSVRRSRLSRVCIENAKLSNSRIDLGGPQVDLPDDCRHAIATRLEDLRYIDESTRPEVSVMRTSGPDLEDSSLD